ncbi:MAG: transcriptional repressor [Bacteroidota bacterium]
MLKIFEQTQTAISVVELVERLQQEMNKTTVYRILDRLEEDGILHSFMGKDGLKWYAKGKECSTAHHKGAHPHFQCRYCGKVECLTMEFAIPFLPNRRVDSAELLLIGQCADCQS